MNSVLERFAKATAARGKYGVDFTTILAIMLPILLECLPKPQDARNAAGNPTALQKVALRFRVRRELSGQFGLFKLAPAVDDCCDAILAEAKAQTELAMGEGDVFEQAIVEARQLAA